MNRWHTNHAAASPRDVQVAQISAILFELGRQKAPSQQQLLASTARSRHALSALREQSSSSKFKKSLKKLEG